MIRFVFVFFFFLSSLFAFSVSKGGLHVVSDGSVVRILPSSYESREEKEAYKKLLKSFQRSLARKTKRRVLIVGCGSGDEIGHVFDSFPAVSKIVACDIDSRFSDFTRRRYKKLEKLVSVHQCDFSVEEPLPRERAFDFVILRHPEPGDSFESYKVWGKIFKNALESLSEGGILLMTTYVEAEAKVFKDLMIDGYCLVRFGRNPFFDSEEYFYKPGVSLGKDLSCLVVQKDSSCIKRFCFSSLLSKVNKKPNLRRK